MEMSDVCKKLFGRVEAVQAIIIRTHPDIFFPVFKNGIESFITDAALIQVSVIYQLKFFIFFNKAGKQIQSANQIEPCLCSKNDKFSYADFSSEINSNSSITG